MTNGYNILIFSPFITASLQCNHEMYVSVYDVGIAANFPLYMRHTGTFHEVSLYGWAVFTNPHTLLLFGGFIQDLHSCGKVSGTHHPKNEVRYVIKMLQWMCPPNAHLFVVIVLVTKVCFICSW